MLHLYFKEYIYDKDSGMTMLTAEIAYDHIEGIHSLSPKIYIGESIKLWKMIARLISRKMFKEDGSFDYKALASLEKTQKIISSLYKEDPKKMNFYNPDMNIDFEKLGNFVQLAPLFTQRKGRIINSKRQRRQQQQPYKENTSNIKSFAEIFNI